MDTMEIEEYVKNLLEEDTSTDSLVQTLIIEAKKIEAETSDKLEEPSEAETSDKMEEPSDNGSQWRPWLIEEPFERCLRSQTTLRRTGYDGNAPTSRTRFRGFALFCLSPKTMKRVRKARRRLFKASGKA